MEVNRGMRKGFCKGKFKFFFCLEGGGGWVNSFSGIWKPLCGGGGLHVIYLVNYDPMWRLNYVQVNIGDLWTFFGVHR